MEHFRPHQPGQFRPMGQGYRSHYAFLPPSHHKGNQDQQNQMGNPHAQIHAPIYKTVRCPAFYRSRHPKCQRNHGTGRRSQCPNPNAVRKPFDAAEKHVPSHLVRAERMGKTGRKELCAVIHPIAFRAYQKPCQQCQKQICRRKAYGTEGFLPAVPKTPRFLFSCCHSIPCLIHGNSSCFFVLL